ncbi:hypothetical protein MVEN_01687800 [Mycena venus]|uniref:Uncharacterized protein n=1 Tax=Mycena venus TaxID=2733690 RepID=A0A8H6XP92_9AGAR|nr:hypothetical protein MVEN_01687800 [Mycena venus]
MSALLSSRSSSPDPQIYKRVILGLIIPGVGLITILLALYGYLAWNPVSRRYLDRVSFRLLVYALGAHLLFAVSFLTGALIASPGRHCALVSFTTDLNLMFSAGMFFCIGLNLPLVIVYSVNGQKMEKYYIIGTFLLSLICGLAPWNAVSQSCWFRSTNSAEMLRWLIGTQDFWTMFFAVGEVCGFLRTIVYLILELDMRRFATDNQITYSYDVSHIILRIGMYPLVSCALNISGAAIDLYTYSHYTGHSGNNWRLNIAGAVIFSGRPLIYGLLAIADPSFIRALCALRHPEKDITTQSHRPTPAGYLSTVIDLPSGETSQLELESLSTNDYEAQKGARGYGRHALLSVGETSTITARASGTYLDGEREPGLNDGYNQSVIIGAPTQTSLAPIEQLQSTINFTFI